MATKLTNKGQGIYEVTTQISGKEWDACQDKAMKKIASQIQIKGFRKGQAPLDMVKDRINPSDLANESINEALPQMFNSVLKEHKLRPFTSPEVKVNKFDKKELDVTFEITVYPEVTLGKYKDIHLELEHPTVSAKEVDEAINKLLEDNAELVLKEEAAAKGDTVIFDFKGYVNGKEFEGGSADNYSLVLGSNTFVPGFEDQLIGVKSETKKDIEVTFPEQYIESLAGKKAKFVCMVHEIKTKRTPKLDEEFIKNLNINGVTSEKELKEHEKAQLLAEKNKNANGAYMNKLIDTICAGSKIEIADAVITKEALNKKDNLLKQIEQNGLTIEQYKQITGATDETMLEQFKEQARVELKQVVVIDKIASEEHLIITRKELDEFYENTAKMYGMKVEDVKKAYAQQESQIASNLENQKIFNFLQANNAPKGAEKKAAAPKKEEAPKKEAKAAPKKTTTKKAK